MDQQFRYRFEGNTYPARARLKRKGWRWSGMTWSRLIGAFPTAVTSAFLEHHYPGCRLSTLESDDQWKVVWTSKTYEAWVNRPRQPQRAPRTVGNVPF